jgi:hypothetical protein
MPIRPENRARYPKDWPDIRARIRARSGNQCECTGQCGVRHPDYVYVSADADVGVVRMPNRCGVWNGAPIDEFEGPCIVLTVAHLDHQPENNADTNLLHLCQGCHNRYDAPMRAAGIKARRRAERASGDLFQCEGT